MKRKILTMILAVSLLLTSGALGEALPSRPDVLPVPESTVEQAPEMPNPGSYFGTEGKLDQSGFSYQGGSYEIWYYEAIPGWNENLNQFLTDCMAAGYEWTTETIEGKNAYVFNGGGKKAYLFTDYYGAIMFMKEEGLPMSAFVKPEEAEPEKGQMRAVINGNVFRFVNGSAYSHNGEIVCKFFEKRTMKIFNLRLPLDIMTGETYTLDQNNKRKNGDEFMASYDGKEYSQYGFHSGMDGIHATILYAQVTSFDLPREIKGHYEGSFNSGKDTLILDFYVEYSY